MEIFQTILNALMTPNENILKYFIILASFIEAIIYMLLFTTILSIPASKKQKFIYVISLSCISFFTTIFFGTPYSTFINIISMLVLIKFIFNIKFLKAIVAIIIPYILLAFIELILSKIILIIFAIDLADLSSIPIYRMFFITIGYLILFLFYKLFEKYNFNINFLNSIDKKTSIILIVNFSLGLIALLSQTYLTTFYSDILPFILNFVSFLSLIAYIFISLYSLSKASKLQKANEDIETLQIYNKTLSILHDNIRGFKHDFNNIVSAIGGYISTEDLIGLKKYYSQLLEDCQRVNNLTALSPSTINNPAIYSILASKYHKADELNIKINLEVFLDLNTLNMKIYEFTRILGILLDNAIEASNECNDKTINVIIRKDFKISRQILIIENTYNNRDVDTEKIFDKGYSSKKNNTGLGLWEVRQILKKNKNLNLFTSKNDTYFRQQLEIY